MGTALILRNCKSDMTSHGGFVYPKLGPVEAPDWNSKAECGGGLHGLIWGEGNWGLLRSDFDAQWQVIEVDEADVVKIDVEKVKFRKGVVVFTGEMSKAVTMVLCHKINFDRTMAEAKEKAVGNSSKAASSGDYSTAASSGNSSTAEAQGSKTIAMVAGYGGSAKAGPDGAFAIAYFHEKKRRPRILVGHVGEKGIKADTWYVARNGKLVKA